MIPTIHDGKKRQGLIKSISPILEESLDNLLNSLREADTAEKMERVITTHEQSELDEEEGEELNAKSALRSRTNVKVNPSSEGYVRRKKSVTHEM